MRLLECSPLHVEQARRRCAEGRYLPVSSEVVDARALTRRGESAGAVLLMGLLYHLTA